MDVIAYLIYPAIFAYPTWRIFSRTGMSGFFALLLLLPLGFIFILYVLAYSKWPAVDRQEKS
jgi:Zn-dependent protease with chaperone function